MSPDTTTLILDLTLLVVGLMSTLSAFGGKTWKEGPEPLPQRITPRGWMSLVLLALAVSLGAIEKLQTKRQATEKEKAADAALASSKLEAKNNEDQLQLANERLKGLTTSNKDLRDELNGAQVTLGDVRTSLSSARDDLNLQSNASLVTALVDSGEKIKDVALVLPLTAKAPVPKNVLDTLLPQLPAGACRDLTGVEVSIQTSEDHFEKIAYTYVPNSNKSSHRYPGTQGLVPKADATADFGDPDEVLVPAGQKSSNGNLYVAVIETVKNSDSAAELYAALTSPNSIPVTITANFASFNGEEFYADHPSFVAASARWSDVLTRYPEDVDEVAHGDRPAPCGAQLRAYFSEAFSNAILVMVMNQQQNEIIGFRLRAMPPKLVDNQWQVSFKSEKPVMFSASKDFADVLQQIGSI